MEGVPNSSRNKQSQRIIKGLLATLRHHSNQMDLVKNLISKWVKVVFMVVQAQRSLQITSSQQTQVKNKCMIWDLEQLPNRQNNSSKWCLLVIIKIKVSLQVRDHQKEICFHQKIWNLPNRTTLVLRWDQLCKEKMKQWD